MQLTHVISHECEQIGLEFLSVDSSSVGFEFVVSVGGEPLGGFSLPGECAADNYL